MRWSLWVAGVVAACTLVTGIAAYITHVELFLFHLLPGMLFAWAFLGGDNYRDTSDMLRRAIPAGIVINSLAGFLIGGLAGLIVKAARRGYELWKIR